MKLGTLIVTLGYVAAMTMQVNTAQADSTNTSYTRKATVAAQLPGYYPSHFPRLGVLTDIRSSHDWNINGKRIKVSPNVIVHSLVTNFSSLYSVKQGMELAYKTNKQGEVAEIWQLPDGAIDRN
jgi:putative hemolysin